MKTSSPGAYPAASMPATSDLERRLVRLEVGGEAALVADRGRRGPRSCRVRLSAWKTSAPTRSASREARRPGGDDHELLEVDRVVGVGAAVEHVHHRHREQVRLLARAPAELGDVAVERAAGLVGGGARGRERDAEDRVGARGATCSGVPSSSISARSSAAWSVGPAPASACAISPLTLPTALRSRPCRPRRSPPSRSSVASNSPVEAPEGTAARPEAPGAERRPRPRRSGCRASRGSGGRGCGRSRPSGAKVYVSAALGGAPAASRRRSAAARSASSGSTPRRRDSATSSSSSSPIRASSASRVRTVGRVVRPRGRPAAGSCARTAARAGSRARRRTGRRRRAPRPRA